MGTRFTFPSVVCHLIRFGSHCQKHSSSFMYFSHSCGEERTATFNCQGSKFIIQTIPYAGNSSLQARLLAPLGPLGNLSYDDGKADERSLRNMNSHRDYFSSSKLYNVGEPLGEPSRNWLKFVRSSRRRNGVQFELRTHGGEWKSQRHVLRFSTKPPIWSSQVAALLRRAKKRNV